MTAQNRRHVHTCASNKANRFQKPSTTSSLYGSSDALNDDDKRHQSQKRAKKVNAELSITYRFCTCTHILNVPPIIGGVVYSATHHLQETKRWKIAFFFPFASCHTLCSCSSLSLDQLQKHSHRKKTMHSEKARNIPK